MDSTQDKTKTETTTNIINSAFAHGANCPRNSFLEDECVLRGRRKKYRRLAVSSFAIFRKVAIRSCHALVLVAILLSLTFFCSGYGADKKDKKDASAQTQSAQVAKTKEVTAEEQSALAQTPPISASKLLAEFNDNEIAAMSKFSKKRIKISGTITDFSTGPFDGDLIVKLRADEGRRPASVDCYFVASERESVAKFRKGQDVVILGYVGKKMLGDVIVKSCIDYTERVAQELEQRIQSAAASLGIGSPKVVSLGGGVSLEMLPVAPGTFLMGSPESETKRVSSETQHSVRITHHYWLGKYEVTQAQWKAVMGSDPSKFKGAKLPVESVSWKDAMEFCEKLTKQERAAGRLPEIYHYTLPKEAQWEYACRAGTTTPFSTGDNLTTDQANYNGNYPYNGNAEGDYRGTSTDVGSFPANAWGFHDMHGNVWEWCADWYGRYPNGSVTDPLGAASGSYRVYRGGCWFLNAQYCRSAYRGCFVPGYRNYNLGFRLALSSVGGK